MHSEHFGIPAVGRPDVHDSTWSPQLQVSTVMHACIPRLPRAIIARGVVHVTETAAIG
jgi:hypothetical protein